MEDYFKTVPDFSDSLTFQLHETAMLTIYLGKGTTLVQTLNFFKIIMV